jgi:WD40 repeat protein
MKLPQEPVTFNIAEVKGEDVHIGDRITIEQILGQKVLYVSVDEIKTREFNPTSPYKGLKKFEPEDKDHFFGRDQFITELANELDQTNLLLLLGASGSGKSSVVRAGLLSWLQKKWGSRLVNLTFTPDQDPFESLYASLLRYYKQPDAQVAREGREDTLTQVVTGLRRSDSFWFIFIDQFEELFTTSQTDKRDRFIASLVQLTTALKLLGSTKDCPVKIVLTMRADFLDRLSPYPRLVKATDKHRPLIAEMRSDELRQAIEQPAAQHGVVFETGLVEEIIKNVQGQAGYLPLLQYTLNLVWEIEEKSGDLSDRTLNISTYRDLGGVRGALQKHVDQIYQALPEAERLAAQRIFLKLVEIGGDEESGTEWKPVRRRALRSEFDSKLEQRVLVQLIDENLLVSDRQPQAQESTVEIAHEALLTSWETLATWIKENRGAIALRNRLNDDVSRWQAKKQDDELWTGSKLEQVLELKKDPTFNQVLGGFSSTANQFVDASVGLRDRQLRRTRIIAGIGITLAALASAAAVFGGYQLQQTARQRIGQYAATSKALLATNSTEGLVYAISAVGLSQSDWVNFPNQNQIVPTEVQSSLLNAVQAKNEQVVIQVPDTEITSFAFSSDGQRIVTGSSDGAIRLWNSLGSPLVEPIEMPEVVGVSLDGERIVAVSRTCGVHIWDLQGKPISSKTNINCYVAAGFSSDGKYVAGLASEDNLRIAGIEPEPGAGSVLLWDSRNQAGKLLFRVPATEGLSAIVKFSPNQQYVIGWLQLDKLNLLDVQGNATAQPIELDEGIQSADFSPDGSLIVTGSGDATSGQVSVWDIKGHLIGNLFQGHRTLVSSVVFSSNGQRIASSDYKEIRLWDLQGNSVGETLSGQGGELSFSPDGQSLAVLRNGAVHILNVGDSPIEKNFQSNNSEVISAYQDDYLNFEQNVLYSFNERDKSKDMIAQIPNESEFFKTAHNRPQIIRLSPDRQIILSYDPPEDTQYDADSQSREYGLRVESQSQGRLWNFQGQPVAQPLVIPGDEIETMKFTSDGKYVIGSGWGGGVYLWDLQGHQVKQFPRINGSPEMSPDGQYILTNSSNGIELWDSSGNSIGTLATSQESRNGHFSLDGRYVVFESDEKMRVRMATWKEWLQIACNRLRYHPILTKPETDVAREAKATCEQYVWSKNQSSETPIADVPAAPQRAEPVKPAELTEVTPAPVASQPTPTPEETSSASTVSPSPLTTSYEFDFPQASCGDPSAKPGSAFPVFIDNKPVEEVRREYCADAFVVSKRQKTGKPSVQVASFVDRQKAEAFAQEVNGEVGEPGGSGK